MDSKQILKLDKRQSIIQRIDSMKSSLCASKIKDKLSRFHYFGYPNQIPDLLIDKIPSDTNYNSKIAIVNDFGLEVISKLIELGYSNLYILCTEENDKLYSIIEYMVEKEFNFSRDRIVRLTNINMNDKFDLVIENPPYGMKNVLAKPIIKNCLEISNEVICLAPAQAYSEVVNNIGGFEESETAAFEDAEMQNLFIATLSKKNNNSIEDIETLLLSNDSNYHLIYNFNKNSNFNLNMGTISSFARKLNMDENRLFMITKWTPLDGVHLDEKSKDIQHNKFKVPIDWECTAVTKAAIDKYIYFNSQIEFDNFCHWWYSNPKVGFTDLILKLIFKSSSMQVDWYKKLLPNIDWSRTDVTYTDEYVLSQMGLKWNENKDGVERL